MSCSKSSEWSECGVRTQVTHAHNLPHSMEKETNNLQREAKAYLDAMRAMTASQTRIAETLELFYTADKSSDVGAGLLADVAGDGGFC